MVNKKSKKDYCEPCCQKKGDLYKANRTAWKKTETKRRKYLEPKNAKCSRKKQLLVSGKTVFKKRCQSNYRSALQCQPRKQHEPHLQHFKQNKFWAKVFTRVKDHSHPVCKRRPMRLELFPKAVHNKSGIKMNKLCEEEEEWIDSFLERSDNSRKRGYCLRWNGREYKQKRYLLWKLCELLEILRVQIFFIHRSFWAWGLISPNVWLPQNV